MRNQAKVLWISENERQRRTALVKMNYYRHPPSLLDRNAVWLESIQPFNIKKLDNGTLVPFDLLPLGPHKLIPVFLPLFKTKQVLFWDRHQLPRCVRLISSLSTAILALVKARSHTHVTIAHSMESLCLHPAPLSRYFGSLRPL